MSKNMTQYRTVDSGVKHNGGACNLERDIVIGLRQGLGKWAHCRKQQIVFSEEQIQYSGGENDRVAEGAELKIKGWECSTFKAALGK